MHIFVDNEMHSLGYCMLYLGCDEIPFTFGL